MKKRLNKNNTLIHNSLYPYYKKKRVEKPYKALLGIGGNIGDMVRRFNHLFIFFRRSPYIEIVETAPILKNPPFGYLKQDDFYNSLVFVKTCLKPKALLRYILRIEKKFGRERSFQDAPRTLDIDMIFYENDTINSVDLTVPHPSWKQRDSVLVPLSYMKSSYTKEKYGKRFRYNNR